MAQTIKVTTQTEQGDDAPNIVAFRVGQLEQRFDKFEDKLDDLASNFATIVYVDKAIADISTNLGSRIAKLESINGWVIKIVLTSVLLGLLGLLGLTAKGML